MSSKIYEEFKVAFDEFQSSPGKRIHDQIDRIQASLRIVQRNRDELILTIQTLQREDVMVKIWDVANRPAMTIALEEVVRRLHNFLASAFGLVDYTRRHRVDLYGDTGFGKEIQGEIDRRFSSNDYHRVAKGLRNISMHVELIPASAVFSWDRKTGASSGFKIPTRELLKWKEWDAEDRRVISRMGDMIDILEFIQKYFEVVEGFYLWLWERQAALHVQEIAATERLRARAAEKYSRLGSQGAR